MSATANTVTELHERIEDGNDHPEQIAALMQPVLLNQPSAYVKQFSAKIKNGRKIAKALRALSDASNLPVTVVIANQYFLLGGNVQPRFHRSMNAVTHMLALADSDPEAFTNVLAWLDRSFRQGLDAFYEGNPNLRPNGST